MIYLSTTWILNLGFKRQMELMNDGGLHGFTTTLQHIGDSHDLLGIHINEPLQWNGTTTRSLRGSSNCLVVDGCWLKTMW